MEPPFLGAELPQLVVGLGREFVGFPWAVAG
jgi:hypothetical protein